MHLETIDCHISAKALLTSASPHDRQAAIPPAQSITQRVTSLYDLLDSEYDATQIYTLGKSLGCVPIIEDYPRGREKIELGLPQTQRFKKGTAGDRINSLLKRTKSGLLL